MQPYQTKCYALYERHLREHFLNIDTGASKRRMEEILQSEPFKEMTALPNVKRINDFMSNLLNEISQQVVDSNMDAVIKNILTDVREFIESVLTEEDAQAVYEFATSQAGSKVLRNLDLLKDAYQDAATTLTVKILERWSDPDIASRIGYFISEIVGDEVEGSDNNEEDDDE
jgi:hypothetical protein